MAKRTRWVEYTMPVLVQVEIDDEFEEERVRQVVLTLGDEPLPALGRTHRFDGIALVQNEHGRPKVYDGNPDADMYLVDDRWAREAVRVAEYRHWPPRRAWEEGPHPSYDPGYSALDDEDDEIDGAGRRGCCQRAT